MTTLQQLHREIWWGSLKWNILTMESRRGIWLFIGHVGIAFRIIPRISTKLMIKIGAAKGIRVSQFGPLVVTWEEKAPRKGRVLREKTDKS
jgi:hypothetical protein